METTVLVLSQNFSIVELVQYLYMGDLLQVLFTLTGPRVKLSFVFLAMKSDFHQRNFWETQLFALNSRINLWFFFAYGQMDVDTTGRPSITEDKQRRDMSVRRWVSLENA